MIGVLILVVWLSCCATEEYKVTFQFPEFDYKETYKNVSESKYLDKSQLIAYPSRSYHTRSLNQHVSKVQLALTWTLGPWNGLNVSGNASLHLVIGRSTGLTTWRRER